MINNFKLPDFYCMKSYEIKRKLSKTEYIFEGTWNELDIIQEISFLEEYQIPELIKYRNFQYQPPTYTNEGFFRKKVEQTPGRLVFESDPISYTLAEYISDELDGKLSYEIALIIIAEVWSILNYLRQYIPHIVIFSLHPSTIVLNETNENTLFPYTIQLTGYIPFLFSKTFSDEEMKFISIEQLKLFEKKKNLIDERCEMHSFGMLIHYLIYGHLPFDESMNIQQLREFKKTEDVLKLQQNENDSKYNQVNELIQLLLINKCKWTDTYTNTFLISARKVAFDEMKASPEDFTIIKRLGKGKSGIVYEASQKTRKGERLVALKEIESRSEQRKFVTNEIEIMKLCRHQNIVQMYDSFNMNHCLKDKREGFFTAISMELCSDGTLETYRKEFPDEVLPDHIFHHCIIGVIKALMFLHNELNILHRDLKPDNILIMTDPNNTYLPIVKISDFGLSKILDENEMTESRCGTPVFMAPEVYFRKPYNFKVDIWSLGTTFYYMKTAQFPLTSSPKAFNEKMVKKIPPEYDDTFWGRNPDMKDFIQHLICYDMYWRYDWGCVMKHPYIMNIWK